MMTSFLLLISTLLFGADRLIKDVWIEKLPDRGLLWFSDWYGGIGLNFVENDGVAFGLPMQQQILLVANVALLLFLMHQFRHYYMVGKRFPAAMVAWVFAGGVSNVIDRVAYGVVIDYIQVFAWPVFNIADILIVVGVIGWAWYLIAVNE
jgi:signal peptidase II